MIPSCTYKRAPISYRYEIIIKKHKEDIINHIKTKLLFGALFEQYKDKIKSECDARESELRGDTGIGFCIKEKHIDIFGIYVKGRKKDFNTIYDADKRNKFVHEKHNLFNKSVKEYLKTKGYNLSNPQTLFMDYKEIFNE